MATTKQRQTARRNVKKAQAGAQRTKTITKLSRTTRRDLGREVGKGRGTEARGQDRYRTRGRRDDGPGVAAQGRRARRTLTGPTITQVSAVDRKRCTGPTLTAQAGILA